MTRHLKAVTALVMILGLIATIGAQQKKSGKGPQVPPLIQPKEEELAKVREKTEQIEALVAELNKKHADPTLLNDVEVYAKAGRMLLEFPELFGTQAAIDRSFQVLDQGVERARELQSGKPQWDEGQKRIEAYRSQIDGSLQPFGITLPANYDPAKPVRLYVSLHGRQNNTTEAEFIANFLRPRPPGNAPVADQGQIQVDCFGRINGAGWHWAGEADVFEAIAAVKKRYKIDDKRVVLRGFSMGGEGAWHIALHHPDEFVAAEIGAGTVSRRARQMPDLQPYQLATLTIWENISEWALNVFNLPLAGHDGENDPGQLESSLRARAQLEKEGFPSEGDKDYLHSVGAPGLWMVSLSTGHGTSPLVRQRLDAFLKEWGDKGQTSPDHLRFVTYTTRYNHDYWVSLDGLEKHYQRADIDAVRKDGKSYDIKTHNVSRLVLRETEHAKDVNIDGQNLKLRSAPEIALQKAGGVWKVDRSVKPAGLHKTHALQGPIDDAFLDPFLLVRPTGTPWNDEVNQQALRSMARFDRMWAKFFRGHPLVKDDKDVTDADFTKYHIVLFGDPGSNRVIAKLSNRLPVKWTKETVTMAGKDYPAKENFPALIYPNPLNPSKYVVLNTGLTIADRDYNGDYGMPRWGDYAVVKVTPGSDFPDAQVAGLFDENWQIP